MDQFLMQPLLTFFFFLFVLPSIFDIHSFAHDRIKLPTENEETRKILSTDEPATNHKAAGRSEYSHHITPHDSTRHLR